MQQIKVLGYADVKGSTAAGRIAFDEDQESRESSWMIDAQPFPPPAAPNQKAAAWSRSVQMDHALQNRRWNPVWDKHTSRPRSCAKG